MRAPSPRMRLPVVLALVLVGGLLAVSPGRVAAGTAESMESSIQAWINKDRQARGLRPLYGDARLADLAGDRATTLAVKRSLDHGTPGDLGSQLNARGIQWYRYGEALGRTSYPWGAEAAAHLYRMWKASSSHWALLMSGKFNYIGIGVVYRGSPYETYASIVLTESLDHTPAYAKMVSGSRTKTNISWSWTGADRLLQTHTAGLRDFDVQVRLDWNAWQMLGDNTTYHGTTLYNLARGHSYAVRVRATDRRGNVGAWSADLRVYIP